jgi:hypothetical protein
VLIARDWVGSGRNGVWYSSALHHGGAVGSVVAIEDAASCTVEECGETEGAPHPHEGGVDGTYPWVFELE